MNSRKTIMLAVITTGVGALTGMIFAKKNNAMGALTGASAGAAAGDWCAVLCM
jgi:hypothetical protein